MSRLVAFAAIQGAYNIVSKAEGAFKRAMDKYGANQPLAFPNTAYYLPAVSYTHLTLPTIYSV